MIRKGFIVLFLAFIAGGWKHGQSNGTVQAVKHAARFGHNAKRSRL
jgi:hypothetical protein